VLAHLIFTLDCTMCRLTYTLYDENCVHCAYVQYLSTGRRSEPQDKSSDKRFELWDE